MTHDSAVLPVQYDLSGGFNVTYRTIERDGLVNTTDEFVTTEDFLMVKSGDGVLAQTHRDLYEHTYLEGGKGHQIHLAIINDGVESPDITIVSNNWGGYFQNELTQLEMANRVLANPNRRFAIFDHLGQGRSDQLSRSAARELSSTGRFDAYAAIVLKGIRKATESYDKVSLLGCSMGGLVVAEMAAQYPRPVDTVVLFDSPGSQQYPVVEFDKRFAIKERAHAVAYLDYAVDPVAKSILSKNVSPLYHALGIAELAWRQEFSTQFLSLPRAMSRGALNQTIGVALPNVEQNFTFISPSHSEFNNPETVLNILQQAVGSGNVPRTIRQALLNGTHAFAFGSPSISAAVEAKALAA